MSDVKNFYELSDSDLKLLRTKTNDWVKKDKAVALVQVVLFIVCSLFNYLSLSLLFAVNIVLWCLEIRFDMQKVYLIDGILYDRNNDIKK